MAGLSRWRQLAPLAPGRKRTVLYSADEKMMVAAVDGRGPTFEVRDVRPLFSVRIRDQFNGIPYDVTSDGEHFLVNATVDRSPFSFINLIVNWPTLLKR